MNKRNRMLRKHLADVKRAVLTAVLPEHGLSGGCPCPKCGHELVPGGWWGKTREDIGPVWECDACGFGKGF